ncbi:MAG: RNA polymerase subunit sigma-24 [Treponema sp.]|nr:MAG: RNA polymerase subunit sigma-24 [Treponema sp.]
MMNNTYKENSERQQEEDIIICKAVLSGNTEAFGFLITKYQNRIYRLGLSFFKNSDDCEDFVQDVMLKAYSALKNFKGYSKFSTWLMRIAYNTAINSVQRKREYSSFAEEFEFISTEKNPEQQYLEKYVYNAVKEAVKNLPEKYRVCIDLYFFYDMPYADIENVTGIPVNTIKSHIFRAKKILKASLDEKIIERHPNLADFCALILKGFSHGM